MNKISFTAHLLHLQNISEQNLIYPFKNIILAWSIKISLNLCKSIYHNEEVDGGLISALYDVC